MGVVNRQFLKEPSAMRATHSNRPRLAVSAAVLAAVAGLITWSGLSAPVDPLEQGFRNPPPEAKPRTWWHWTNGNVTKEGITKDLEWMRRAGIGGFMLADVASGGGQSVERKIPFGSVEWLDAVRHAAAEADRLGLEMAIFSSAGWSLTGGPWVKPGQAMKKLVWSEAQIEGPQSFRGRLPSPPSNNGPFGNLERGGGTPGSPPDPTYYADSAVVAFPTPAAEQPAAAAGPRIVTSAGPVGADALLDGDLNTAFTLKAPADGSPAWIQYEFSEPFPARAFTIAGRSGIPFGRLAASDDGASFRTLVTLPGAQLYRAGTVRTFAFPETRARIYRLELTGEPARPAAVMAQTPPKPGSSYTLSEFRLLSGARVHRWEEKAGFSFLFEYGTVPTPPAPAAAVISESQVIDLTARMKPDGTLDWEAPPGRWTVLRIGYSLTGAKNRPAPPSGLGFEADKLSREHIEAYFHGYFDPIARVLGPLCGRSLRYLMMDSWEAGTLNWTEQMMTEFRRRRRYDPTPYLPTLTGRVVSSAEVSDRFLWDFRRTLAELIADNHYGVMAELARQHGLGIYAEASGVSLEIPEDTLLNKSKVEIPMGEFWVRALHPELMYWADVRGAASAAHVYGKPLVAAEAFTGGGYESPYSLKKTADPWFAQGVNRIVFHTSAHQPLDTKPGNVMVGTHLHRNITWAEQALPFTTYLARVSYMLQQGRFVADLAYLLDEGAPSTIPFWGAGLVPPPPVGYDYDCLNADVLVNRASMGPDGALVLPGGMTYRVLVLPESRRMTLPVLRKIRELAAGGVTVVGPKPLASPSLASYPDADREIAALAGEVWGDLDGVSRTRRAFGKGNVFWGIPVEQVLRTLDIPRDLDYAKPLDFDLAWIHRRSGEADIYFVASLSDRPAGIEARFRVQGKEAEIWRPDTGEIEPASYAIHGPYTTVSLPLAEREAVFVVFRRAAQAESRMLPRARSMVLASLEGPWAISFPPGLGAPPEWKTPQLVSWTTSPVEGIRYFSGTATYHKTIRVPASWLRGDRQIWLELGAVGDVAEVSLNGKPAASLWKPPYRAEVTSLLRAGENQLEIRVTNQWTNRIAGDRRVKPEQRVLPSVPPGGAAGMFGAAAEPPESGLLGPVRLVSVAQPNP